METNYETWPVSRLVAKIFDLEAEIDALKNASGHNAILHLVKELKITASEARILATLADGKPRSNQQIFDCLYYDRFDDAPEMKIVDVLVCKLRKKIKPFGLQIGTIWGLGYQLKSPLDLEKFVEGQVPAKILEIQEQEAVPPGPRQWGHNLEGVYQAIKSRIDDDGYAKFTSREMAKASAISAPLAPILNTLEGKGVIRVKARSKARDPQSKWTVLLRSAYR